MKRALCIAAVLTVFLTGCMADPAGEVSISVSESVLSYHQISQEEAKRMMQTETDYCIVDVRRQDEFDAGHIPGAILIPNESITDTPPEELPDLSQTLLIYCRSGNRSKQASEKLAAMGYTNIYEFGGINTWDGEIVTDDAAVPETAPALTGISSAQISYLGPEGTYTQEACEVFFEGKGTLLPYETVPEAVQALTGHQTNYAVIPQENTIGGAVTDYVDTVISQTDISVIGEVELPISQNLLVCPGTELGGITTVYSHKQGIAQGKDWLAEHLPDAALVEVSSTAEGARMVAESKDPSVAAIASAGCADVYGLEILAPAIQKNDLNKTRFYVLSAEAPPIYRSERLAFVASGSAQALPALLTCMEAQDMTLVTIHDRPMKTELGEYHYLIECRGSYESYTALTETPGFAFRFLGCFDVKSK